MNHIFWKFVNSSLSNDTVSRESWYVNTIRDLETRLHLARRAKDNLTKVHTAFTDGIPLLTYWVTPDRWFDNSLLYSDSFLEHMLHHDSREQKYFDKYNNYLNDYVSVLEDLILLCDNVYYQKTIDWTYTSKRLAKFESRSRSINYYRFLYGTRIVHFTSNIAQELIETFLTLNDTMYGSIKELEFSVYNIEALLHQFNKSSWSQIVSAVLHANMYLKDKRLLKVDLALRLTSKEINEHLKTASTFFKDMRTRGQQFRDSWLKFQSTYSDIWSSMLGETMLFDYYVQINSDLNIALGNSTYMNTLADIFARMFYFSPDDFKNLTVVNKVRSVNGDFATLNLNDVLLEIDINFTEVVEKTNIVKMMGDEMDLFIEAVANLQTALQEFLNSINMDSEFYR